jgi:hypothetical protein
MAEIVLFPNLKICRRRAIGFDIGEYNYEIGSDD